MVISEQGAYSSHVRIIAPRKRAANG
jgi:hypothetical protein